MTLEARITRIEAELSIRNVIARYGLAADCGDVDSALACHTEDAIYVVSNPNAGRGSAADDLELKGHKAIKDMLQSNMHQSLLPNCAHTVGPLIVRVNNMSATVLGYSRVYNHVDNKAKLMRLAVNRWDMRKDEGWKISRRESRVMGEDAAQKLLTETLNEI